MKPRGCGADPGAAGAESPAPEPRGPGAFPRLPTRGAGFSQPSRLSRMPGMPSRPVSPPWAALRGSGTPLEPRPCPWEARPWSIPEEIWVGAVEMALDDVPSPPVLFSSQNHRVGICPVGERDQGWDQGWDQGSAPAPSCPRQPQAGAGPRLPPSLCNLSQVSRGEAGGDGQSRTHTRRGGNPGKNASQAPGNDPRSRRPQSSERGRPRAPEYQRFQP